MAYKNNILHKISQKIPTDLRLVNLYYGQESGNSDHCAPTQALAVYQFILFKQDRSNTSNVHKLNFVGFSDYYEEKIIAIFYWLDIVF